MADSGLLMSVKDPKGCSGKGCTWGDGGVASMAGRTSIKGDRLRGDGGVAVSAGGASAGGEKLRNGGRVPS